MKKSFLLFVLLIICLFGFAFINSNPGIIISRLGGHDFEGAKELKYRVYLFGIIPAGEAILRVEKETDFKGKKVYHLSASAESLKIFSSFFHSNIILDTYVDLASLNPVYFKQKISVSGKEAIEKEVFYDQENNIMTIGDVKRKISVNTLEPLSVVLNLKRMDLEKDRNFQMHLNTNQKDYLLEGTSQAKELKVGSKELKIAKTKINIRRSDKNNPYHRSSLDMVLVRDKQNIPVLIKVFASGFYITVKLTEVK